MSDELMKIVEATQLREDLPEFGPGDTIDVHLLVREGDKERIQIFRGTVISENGSGASRTITVRKVSEGVGVERIFFVHSPRIEKIERIREGEVRRAKLHYLRERKGKSARVREKRQV